MWWIPLSFTGQNNPDFSLTRSAEWLNNTETEKTLENLPQSLDEWVVFNLQETGYYRVNYDQANWLALSQQLASNHSVIHLVNRAQLLDDSLNLARAGKTWVPFASVLTSIICVAYPCDNFKNH